MPGNGSRRCAMVADRIPNPRHEGSTPSTDAFPVFTDIGTNNDNWTFIAFLPAPCGAGRGPVVGQRPGHLIWVEGNGGSSPSNWTRRPQDAQLPAERAPKPGRRLQPGEALDCRCRPTHAPCAGNPKTSGAGPVNARGSTGESACLRSRRVQVRILPGVLCPKRKWAMRRDVTPEEAGSSPAGHPRVRRAHAAYVVRPAALAQLGEAPGLEPGGSGFESLGPH